MDTATGPTTISVRLRPDASKALNYLLEDGKSKSETVQSAVIAAARLKRQDELRRESAALLDDPEDLAEMRRVAEFIDLLRD